MTAKGRTPRVSPGKHQATTGMEIANWGSTLSVASSPISMSACPVSNPDVSIPDTGSFPLAMIACFPGETSLPLTTLFPRHLGLELPTQAPVPPSYRNLP